MRAFNIHAAKTHLSRLVDEVAGGQSVVICKSGKPMAQLVPCDAPKARAARRIGFMKGVYTIPENYWEIDRQLDKEVEELLYGKE